MAENKNALAELAERLTPDHVVNVNGRATAEEIDFDALIKAQRIIAELSMRNISLIPTDCYGCGVLKTLANCRRIAEEGDAG